MCPGGQDGSVNGLIMCIEACTQTIPDIRCTPTKYRPIYSLLRVCESTARNGVIVSSYGHTVAMFNFASGLIVICQLSLHSLRTILI